MKIQRKPWEKGIKWVGVVAAITLVASIVLGFWRVIDRVMASEHALQNGSRLIDSAIHVVTKANVNGQTLSNEEIINAAYAEYIRAMGQPVVDGRGQPMKFSVTVTNSEYHFVVRVQNASRENWVYGGDIAADEYWKPEPPASSQSSTTSTSSPAAPAAP